MNNGSGRRINNVEGRRSPENGGYGEAREGRTGVTRPKAEIKRPLPGRKTEGSGSYRPKAEVTRTPKRGSYSAGRSVRPYGAVQKADEKSLAKAEKEKRWYERVTRTKGSPDRIFFILVALLISLGIVMIYTASYPAAIAKGLSGSYYVIKQLRWIAIGTVMMLICTFFPTHLIKKFSPAIYGFSILMLIAVLIFGTTAGGAKRWINITEDIRIQPSEIAKLAIVLMLAWYLSNHENEVRDKGSFKNRLIYGVLIPGAFIGVMALLIAFEKHLSGLGITVILGVVVLFLGGVDLRITVPFYMGLAAVGVPAYLVINPYALERVTTFFDDEADILDEAWQTYQGTLAIGSGGFLGLGLGQSRQKYSYVSEAHNDFIFTIWCEEMGFVGAVAVIALFMALIIRGYRIALRAPDKYSSLIVFGIVTQVGVQAFLNIMVVSDAFFNTGVSLPFLSYGGTSLVMLMAEMGIVLGVSRRSYEILE